MNLNIIYGFIVVMSLSSCKYGKPELRNTEILEASSTELKLDHFNIWVENPQSAKERLTELGFTSVPDSLSQVHKGQGTAGRYFNFLNGYLELIFVYDQDELAENNDKNKDLDFTARANFRKNGASPFSIALKIKDYKPENIPFENVPYHQDWMKENVNIYSAKSSKKKLQEPSVFVVYPEIESETFETMHDLKNIPDEYAFAREFYKHPIGAKKITNIIVTSYDLDLDSETIKAINGIKNITVKNGLEHLMELYFDKNIQGKSFDLRPELPLKIYL